MVAYHLEPAKKERLQIVEDWGRRVIGTKLYASKDFLLQILSENLLFLLWLIYTTSIHV